MNTLPPLYIFVVCLFIGAANAADSHPMLESPACIDSYRQPSPAVRELSSSLRNKLFKSFYEKAKKHTHTFKVTTRDNVDTELREKIWHCYLVALAPTFSFNTYKHTEPEINIDEMSDINQKSKVCLFMEKYIRLVRKTDKISEPEKKRIITRLLLPYYAHILRQFKSAHETNPFRITEDDPQQGSLAHRPAEEQVKKLRHLKMEDLRKLMNDVATGESFINTRNQVFEDEVKELEKTFMEILVAVFPGNYANAEEFLLKAGYSKEDIPALIDRTVGRNSKTDFLYKGKHRSNHDRLLRKKK